MRYVNGKPVKTDPKLLETKPKKKYRNKKSNKYYRNISGLLCVLLYIISFITLVRLEYSNTIIAITFFLIPIVVVVIFEYILKYDIGFEDGERKSKENSNQEYIDSVIYNTISDD